MPPEVNTSCGGGVPYHRKFIQHVVEECHAARSSYNLWRSAMPPEVYTTCGGGMPCYLASMQLKQGTEAWHDRSLAA